MRSKISNSSSGSSSSSSSRNTSDNCRNRFINLTTKKNKYKIVVNRNFVNRNWFLPLKRYYFYKDYFILDSIKPPIKILNKLSYDQYLRKCYRRFWSSIRTFKHINNKNKDVYNFRLHLSGRLNATSKLKKNCGECFKTKDRLLKLMYLLV